jgi:hypothetical protein
LNLDASTQIRELRWVFVPWDVNCPNFAIGYNFTREQFEAVWATSTAGNRSNMLLNGTIQGLSTVARDVEFNIDVPGNGRLWILGEEFIYTSSRDFRFAYTFDNF